MTEPIRVHFDGLVKYRERVAAVDGATLELPAGRITVVLGPSGSGKTTLARLLAGLDTPDGGDIFFDARLVRETPAHERGVGLVFQDDALWPLMTVADNVAYALRLRNVPKSERRERASEALNALKLDSVATRYPDDLSGLQRQRVALARALAVRPQFLILDEPFGCLEPRVRDAFRDDVRKVHDENDLTTLVLTDDSEEAFRLADHLAVMDLGKIAQAGTPSELYNRPADAFVARLLGATNLVNGEVEGPGARGEVIVRTPYGRLVGRAVAAEPASGAAVTVSIRPEALSLTSIVPGDQNRFPATVERLVFLGELREAHLRGPGDVALVARALQSQTQGLREGQSVTLWVPPDHVVVLPGKYAVTR